MTKFTEECAKGELTREELVTVLRYTATWQARRHLDAGPGTPAAILH